MRAPTSESEPARIRRSRSALARVDASAPSWAPARMPTPMSAVVASRTWPSDRKVIAPTNAEDRRARSARSRWPRERAAPSATMRNGHVDDAAADPEHARQHPDGKADDDALPHVHPVVVCLAAHVDDAPESRASRGPDLDADEQERRDRQQDQPAKARTKACAERARVRYAPPTAPGTSWPPRISIPARDRRGAGADTPRSRTGR